VEQLTESDRKRLALHESAHICAAIAVGRPVGRVRIGASGGDAEVGFLPGDHQASLEEILSELVILLIGQVVTRSPAMPSGWDEEQDEARALALASRACRTHDEIAALLELARARARTLAAQASFIERVEQLWPVLASQGSMSAEQINDHLNGKEAINGKSSEG
jgi:hypothetical protein